MLTTWRVKRTLTSMRLDLPQLIAAIEADDTPGPLDRVGAAAALKDRMEHMGDELLDHFVKAARDEGCSWNQIGTALGVTRQAAQQRHGGVLGRLVEGLRSGLGFQRFSPRARAVVIAAQTVARDRSHDRVGTEHVVLALYETGSGDPAVAALDQLGVDRAAVEAAIAEAHPDRPARPRGHLRFGDDAKTALEEALAAAVDLGHDHIGSEHLLLGLTAAGGLGGRVLAAEGATADALRPVLVTLIAGRGR